MEAPATLREGTNMFLSILTIAIVVAAGVYMVRNLIFSGLVERTWREPMPGPSEEGYQEALRTRYRQERTRMRSALAVIALWAACVLLTAIMKDLWIADTELIRIGGVAVSTLLMWVVAIRSVIHSARSTERSLARTFRHHDRQDRDRDE